MKNPNDNKLNLLIILVLIVGFIATIGTFFLISQTGGECEQIVPVNQNLTEDDVETLVALEYESGFCERLGLESNILIQDLNGVPYGIPICIAGEGSE